MLLGNSSNYQTMVQTVFHNMLIEAETMSDIHNCGTARPRYTYQEPIKLQNVDKVTEDDRALMDVARDMWAGVIKKGLWALSFKPLLIWESIRPSLSSSHPNGRMSRLLLLAATTTAMLQQRLMALLVGFILDYWNYTREVTTTMNVSKVYSVKRSKWHGEWQNETCCRWNSFYWSYFSQHCKSFIDCYYSAQCNCWDVHCRTRS